MAQGHSTELEALIAAMLGDVVKLNKEVTSLRADLGPQVGEMRRLLVDVQEAARAASSPPAALGDLQDVLAKQVAESRRLLQATVTAGERQVASLKKMDPWLAPRWVQPAVTAAAVVIVSVIVWAAASKRDPAISVMVSAAARDPALCHQLGGQDGKTQDGRTYCAFLSPAGPATQGEPQ